MNPLLEGLAPWPEADFTAFGPVETRKLSRIQTLVGAFLGRNWVAIPHVTHQDEADITELEQRRRDRNAGGVPKITIVPLLVKAIAAGLKAFPQFNASLDPVNKTLVLKQYVHVGVAVDTPGGLLVPVVRDCDTKSLDAVAAEIAALSEKARTKGLPMTDMSGGCMTLTSLGHIGGTGFTPIVNAPEVAILGVTRVRVVATPAPNGGVDWRQVLPLSLSYDHRVINGADAARFCRFIADRLAGPALFD
ncbi:2-oxo acid dehydrogenase subunit E2 [Nitrospirillum sp. BR 11164]|uniref:2-oxo acid dehydrogenase subunit E2 n=1 Tax=Nitrospirillum sp. BR 11164 TaxID=3104324 RepID=UPI002AFF981A|nr:2-oxo acid dehydrogenase subunit E2 [Nitrospirillum sp. BR 11164]MEA1652863.1 2-oxo acid dehydrogenase subunit E2 [Nitrospirillum sp. BR 11164]